VLQEILQAPVVPDVTWPVEGAVDEATLALAARAGGRSLLLSADDALAPGALARAVSVMDQDESIGMTYGMALIIADDSDIPEVHETGPVTHQVISGERFLERCCARGNPVPTPTAVVRTSLQHRLGGYRPELPHSGDMEMWMRFAIHAPVAVLGCSLGPHVIVNAYPAAVVPAPPLPWRGYD